jgi:restriction endonuclease Mrr
MFSWQINGWILKDALVKVKKEVQKMATVAEKVYMDLVARGKDIETAKRWGNKYVGHGEIRDFSGALDLKHVEKGVFITTSGFNTDAKQGVDRSSKRIILIDGNQLAKLIVEYDIGVNTENEIKLKRIDKDYFVEE